MRPASTAASSRSSPVRGGVASGMVRAAGGSRALKLVLRMLRGGKKLAVVAQHRYEVKSSQLAKSEIIQTDLFEGTDLSLEGKAFKLINFASSKRTK